MKRLLHAALALTVFASALLGVGVHDHTLEALRFSVACIADHGEEHPQEHAHESDLHVEAAGPSHEHSCVACLADRVRTAFLPASSPPLPLPDQLGAIGPSATTSFQVVLVDGASARGPPSLLS